MKWKKKEFDNEFEMITFLNNNSISNVNIIFKDDKYTVFYTN